MSVNQKDILLPINENNRDENLLIEYDGFIKNTAEALIMMLELEKEENLKKYPRLQPFLNSKDKDLYNDTVLFSPEQLLGFLSNNTLSTDEIMKELDELFQRFDIINFQLDTVFEYALMNLADMDYVKSISIVSRRGFKNYELDYIRKTFHKNIKKFDFYIGNINELIKTGKYTTVFTNDADGVITCLKEMENDVLEKILFIIRICIDTIDLEESDSTNRYIHLKEIEEITKDKQRAVTYMYTDYFSLEEELNESIETETPLG